MNRRGFLKTLGASAVMLNSGGAFSPWAQDKATRPNIILILADDLGYGELGCFGQQRIATPNIDNLCSEGMKFTQFYANCVCSPTRASLLTGQLGGHHPVTAFPGRGNNFRTKLPADAALLPDRMRQAGYRASMYGKWHVGPIAEMWPHWDFAYVTRAANHGDFKENDEDNKVYWPHFMLRNGKEEPVPENQDGGRKIYSEDLYASALEEQIAAWDEGRPEFVYFATHIPHAPMMVPDKSRIPYEGRFEEKPLRTTKKYPGCETPATNRAAMISHLDGIVGRIRAAVEARDPKRPTIIFFTSDNGPASAGTVPPSFFQGTGPLRGIKGSTYEGGIRVPMIAWGPGLIPAGERSDFVSHVCDFMPTCLDLAGAPVPGDIDGLTVAPTLLAGGKNQVPHPYLFWNFWSVAIRMDDWKGVYNKESKAWEIYNLADDPGETTDLAAERQEIARRFDEIRREHLARKP